MDNSLYQKGYLKVDHIHNIYYECHGEKTGKPVLIFHGGPGYGCDHEMLRPFDLTKWNVIMFDQRGCGHSEPRGCIVNNTTKQLVEDVKKLTRYLNIQKFVIKGESWGSTLGLLYAEKYPDSVLSMILTGVFLGNNTGTLIGKNGGFEKFFPELWDEFLSFLPEDKKKQPYVAYYDFIMNGNIEEKEKFARELIYIESLIELPNLNIARANDICDSLDVYNIAKIETYYTINDFFVDTNQIINNAHNISKIPISIIHGRYDLIVPVKSAWELSKHLDNCDLHIVGSGGHSDLSFETEKILKNIANKHLAL